jgi:hypothetical protein
LAPADEEEVDDPELDEVGEDMAPALELPLFIATPST